jgi:tetratricopeptide (TPR) repeat protein
MILRKTEIAIEYAHRFLDDRPQAEIFWVHCENATNIDTSFRLVAQHLQLPGHDDPTTDTINQVCRFLRRDKVSEWFLVLDNADDVELLRDESSLGKLLTKLKRPSRGSVLITTRDRQAAQSVIGKAQKRIQLEQLTPPEALTLFRSKLAEDVEKDEELELQILEHLDYLPLCIIQAAAYLDYVQIPWHDYLIELQDERSLMKMMFNDEDSGRDLETSNAVLKTWKVSFEKIRDKYAQASRVLAIMGFLDRQSINRDLLDGVLESPYELSQALGTLQRFSLIVAEPSQRSYRMHRLVQFATKFWLAGKKEGYETLALKLVAIRFCAANEDPGVQLRLIAHAKLVTTYEISDPDARLVLATLQDRIASYELRAGQYNAAAVSCEQAYNLRVLLLSPSHIDTLRTKGLLGVIKRYQGQFKKACKIQKAVLEAKEKILGPDDLDTIDTVSDLADVFEREADFVSSQPLVERALGVRKRSLHEDHPKTLQSQMQLALLLRRRVRYKESEKLYRDALSILEQKLTRMNVTTLECMNSLASLLRDSGQYEKAVEMSKDVFVGRESLLTNVHPQTLIARNNLSLSYWRFGLLKKAEEEMRATCELYEENFGKDNVDLIQSYSNLSIILRDAGNYKDSEQYARYALAYRKKIFGESHHLVVYTTAELARTLGMIQDYEEAEKLASWVIMMRSESLGVNHPLTLNTRFTLGTIKQSTGHGIEAKRIFESVLEARTSVLGEQHKMTKETLARLEALSLSV